MLAELRMKLSMDESIRFHSSKGSLLHGVIMQTVSEDYSERLHETGLNPFSSSVERENKNWIWSVRTMTKEAYEQIIMPMLREEFREFELEHNETKITIVSKELKSIDKKDLMNRFYSEKIDSNYITVRFVTPTAFKSGGQYVFYPDLGLIFNSLMNKYNACSLGEDMYDEDTLEQIVNNQRIVNYELKSVRFGLEGVKIPGFVGQIEIKLTGPDTMKRFVRMLLEYGEYAGIGIKCSLGMGSIEVIS